MLVEFQRALADLTASPTLCRRVRAEPQILRDSYELSDKEWRRLVGLASSRGMEANCMLYRANRLAPVALNVPATCKALGDDLNRLISAYWESQPVTDVNFLVEADRFCQFLLDQREMPAPVLTALAREHNVVRGKLAASRSIARHSVAERDLGMPIVRSAPNRPA